MAVEERLEPGGASMNGMNLSGNPGMVQPMQMPPTLGQPPIPAIQPRLGTLHCTTGPQQPSLTRHCGEHILWQRPPARNSYHGRIPRELSDQIARLAAKHHPGE